MTPEQEEDDRACDALSKASWTGRDCGALGAVSRGIVCQERHNPKQVKGVLTNHALFSLRPSQSSASTQVPLLC